MGDRMNPNRIKPGDRVRLHTFHEVCLWGEPAGDVPDPDDHPRRWVPGYARPGTILVAGHKAIWRRDVPIRWYRIENGGGWFPLGLVRESTLLEWLPDYGPMGALVIDDPTGEDVCADA